MKFQDLTGEVFGRLTVLERDKNQGRRTMWKCRCKCGNIVSVRAENLKSGNTKSCGCYSDENRHIAHKKHGMSNTKLFSVFNTMKSRCFNKNCYEYDIYGGRGISICSEWLNDSSSFFRWALDNGYSEGLSIDRIDTNGDYCPENCRWVDSFTQANNTRKNIYITYDGETNTLKEWSRILGINYGTLYNRCVKQKWSLDKAFNKEKHVNQFI